MARHYLKHAAADRRRRWTLLSACVVAAAFLMAGRFLPVETWLMEFNEWIAGKGSQGLLLFAAGYALGTVLFIPGSLLTMGAGFVFGVFWGTVVVTVGSTVGDTLAFLIARYLARYRIQHLARKYRKFAAMDHAIGEHGWKIVLMLRLSPLIPFNLSNYLYGLTAIRFWPYVWSSLIGVFPGTLLFVYLGVAGKASLQAVTGRWVPDRKVETALLVGGLLMSAIATFYISRIAKRALKRERFGNAELS